LLAFEVRRHNLNAAGLHRSRSLQASLEVSNGCQSRYLRRAG
jgi:hypothetical protein